MLRTIAVGLMLASLPRVVLAQSLSSNSPAAIARQVRDYREKNEHRIIQELTELLAIPNTADDTQNIQLNATKLVAMLQRRGLRTALLPIPGRGPVIFGELKVPSATHTLVFYCHYDGQPVELSGWIESQPFVAVLRTASIESGGKVIPFPSGSTRFQDDWRIYARSASDDKSPIIAMLAALDALREKKIPQAVNLKVVFEGEEEAGSTHLAEVLAGHQDLLAGDVLIVGDGPIDQSGRPLIFFGNRGVVSIRMTLYGPLRPLHSGHYGNFAPNPAMRMAQLLATMKNRDGRVLIENFYDDMVPLGPSEQRALGDAPAEDVRVLTEFGLASPDGSGRNLLQLITEPSLNIDGLSSGWTGTQAKTIIPDKAEASLDMRLVKNIQPDQQVERVRAHIRKQGYVVLDREPTAEERLKYPRIVRLQSEGGYPATRTSMDLPVSIAIQHVVDEAAGQAAVKLPTLGGSVPMYIFEDMKLPVIGVPIVNFDNNQHSPNENLRLGNLWWGIEIYGALLGSLRW